MVKNAIVVSLSKDILEIKDLTETLGYEIINDFIQNKNKPDPNSYIGPGKVNEIKDYIEKNDVKIDLLVINGKLKPSQWFFLEKKIGTEVFDRIRLILKIFEKHAESREARLQVKLAQLEYERSFVRELIHRARSGEHPGFMAGGEYQVDDYYEMIKKQTKKLKSDLEKIRNERNIRRQHRHKGGFFLVSLAGYTNAGKSSLLNILSDEKVKVEGKLFSTLSTTTRRIIHNNIPVLLTDTVGFIKDLPAIIIDAFHSTLEEIEVADVVLLVLDISEELEIVEEKFKVSINELSEIGVDSNIIIVCNKIDKINLETLEYRIKFLKNLETKDTLKFIGISIKSKKNIDKLMDIIYSCLPGIIRYKICLPFNEEVQSIISWIYEKANVVDVKYDKSVELTVESDSSIKEKILSKSKKYDIKILE